VLDLDRQEPLVGRLTCKCRGAATPKVGPKSAEGWEPPTASATAAAIGPACDADSHGGEAALTAVVYAGSVAVSCNVSSALDVLASLVSPSIRTIGDRRRGPSEKRQLAPLSAIARQSWETHPRSTNLGSRRDRGGCVLFLSKQNAKVLADYCQSALTWGTMLVVDPATTWESIRCPPSGKGKTVPVWPDPKSRASMCAYRRLSMPSGIRLSRSSTNTVGRRPD